VNGIPTLKDLIKEGSENEKEFAHKFAKARGSINLRDKAWYNADNDWTRLVGTIYKERNRGYQDAVDEARKALEAAILGVQFAGPPPK
jgi:hypothetical protein